MSKTVSASAWKTSGGLAGLLLLLVILVAANALVGGLRLRLDVTQDKLYSLSAGTRKLLDKLDGEVQLKMYFNASSPQTPVDLKNYARQVEDLLHEYRLASRGKITLEKYDPKPDSDEEDWAQKYGIQGQQVDMFGSPIYFGLVAVAKSGTGEAAIPVVDPGGDQLLEYNVTRMIYRALHPEKPTVGVISGLPVLGFQPPQFNFPGQPRPQPQPAWIAFQDLRQDYNVREIAAGDEAIDPSIGTLIVVHPKGLSDGALYAIDQFVLRGGRLLAFVDPVSVFEMMGNPGNPFQAPQTSSSLDKLFAAWGVKYESDKVVADKRLVTRIRGGGGRAEDNPVWLTLRRESIAGETMTAQLDNILLPLCGAFSGEGAKDLTLTPLLSSSDDAGLVNAMMASFGGEAVQREFKKSPTRLHMAVRVAGKFKTAFPDGRPKKEEEKKDEEKKDEKPKPPADASLKDGESAVVLVADTDLLYDRFCVEELNFFGARAHRPFNDNLNFLANAIEQMAGSSDLVNIRSRGVFNRPFDRVDALEAKARLEWQERERELTDKLQEAQRQLNELQSKKDKNQKYILSPEQKEAIARFKAEEMRTKDDLKEVRKKLRRDVEALGVKVKAVNLLGMPLLVAVLGIVFGIHRSR